MAGFGADESIFGASVALQSMALAYKVHACPFCTYTTPRKDLLDGHLRTHTGVKPFSCPYCPYTSADRSNLRRHKRNHEL
ncbi:hypothetical protein SK128_000481, partial [Halocaridina rubra]